MARALVIGTIVLIGLLTERLGIESGPIAWVGSLDLTYVGFAIVGLFVLTWAVAVAVAKLGRTEERWATPDPAPSPAGADPRGQAPARTG